MPAQISGCMRTVVACPICGRNAQSPHHIIPRSQGGTDDTKNEVLVCKECHDILEAVYDETGMEYCPALARAIRLEYGFRGPIRRLATSGKPRLSSASLRRPVVHQRTVFDELRGLLSRTYPVISQPEKSFLENSSTHNFTLGEDKYILVRKYRLTNGELTPADAFLYRKNQQTERFQRVDDSEVKSVLVEAHRKWY